MTQNMYDKTTLAVFELVLFSYLYSLHISQEHIQ